MLFIFYATLVTRYATAQNSRATGWNSTSMLFNVSYHLLMTIMVDVQLATNLAS